MAKIKAPPATRTFILTLLDGTVRKITIPGTWKLTFGQLVPYVKRGERDYGAPHGGDRGGVALRFYEGNKENLMAVMTDVRSFRETTMQVVEKRTSTKTQIMQKQTDRGAKNVAVEARVSEWVDPDADPDTAGAEEFTKLPKWED